jgi:hypothetical protein
MNMLKAAAAAVATISVASVAWAAGDDYRFELASPPPGAAAGNAVVEVRLVHVPDGKPVPDAVVFRTRLDMGPDGMPTMTGPAKLLPAASGPGVYAFEIEPSMAGKWALTLAAKVQGEPETVSGSIMIAVPE